MRQVEMYLVGLERNITTYMSLGHQQQYAVDHASACKLAGEMALCTSLKHLVLDLHWISLEAFRVLLLHGAARCSTLESLSITNGLSPLHNRCISQYLTMGGLKLRSVTLSPSRMDLSTMQTLVDALERSPAFLTSFNVRPQFGGEYNNGILSRFRVRINTALHRNRQRFRVGVTPTPQPPKSQFQQPPPRYSPPQFISPALSSAQKRLVPAPPSQRLTLCNVPLLPPPEITPKREEVSPTPRPPDSDERPVVPLRNLHMIPPEFYPRVDVRGSALRAFLFSDSPTPSPPQLPPPVHEGASLAQSSASSNSLSSAASLLELRSKVNLANKFLSDAADVLVDISQALDQISSKSHESSRGNQ